MPLVPIQSVTSSSIAPRTRTGSAKNGHLPGRQFGARGKAAGRELLERLLSGTGEMIHGDDDGVAKKQRKWPGRWYPAQEWNLFHPSRLQRLDLISASGTSTQQRWWASVDMPRAHRRRRTHRPHRMQMVVAFPRNSRYTALTARFRGLPGPSFQWGALATGICVRACGSRGESICTTSSALLRLRPLLRG